jgi:Fe-S cluster assembly protein SufD
MAVTDTAFDVAPLERLVHPLPTESANGTAARRSEAFAWIAEHGMPTRHDEPWHYSPHNELGTAMGNAAPAQSRSVDPSTVESLAGLHGGPRLVFVNGFYSADLSDPATSSEVWCGPGGQVPSEQHSLVETAEAREFTDGFHALNRADGGEAAVVIAAPGSNTDAPIHIVHLTVPGDTLEVAHPRTVIVIGQNANAAIIESFVGLDGAALRNTDTTISLGADATLTHHRVQTEAGEAIHIGHTDVIQAANSTLMSTSVMFGARIARNAFRVEFTGEHATANLSGIQVLNEGQRHDTMITADHRASSCYSDQEFKSVIEERSRSSFSGHIIVRPGVVDTDAHQTNRNLLLSPNGQADTRPWLEIFADDVRCTHGATVGRLDDEALFYLRSRGVEADLARSMLIDAFIREVIDTVKPKSLRDHLKAIVAAKHAEVSIGHDDLHREAKRLDAS